MWPDHVQESFVFISRGDFAVEPLLCVVDAHCLFRLSVFFFDRKFVKMRSRIIYEIAEGISRYRNQVTHVQETTIRTEKGEKIGERAVIWIYSTKKESSLIVHGER